MWLCSKWFYFGEDKMNRCNVCGKIIWGRPYGIHLKYFFGDVHKKCMQSAVEINNKKGH